MKLFDPNITKGEWFKYECSNIDSDGNTIITVDIGGKCLIKIPIFDKEDKVLCNAGDISAIVALPKLLEVYKAAKPIIECNQELMGQNILPEISKAMAAIKNLEDRHCK